MFFKNIRPPASLREQHQRKEEEMASKKAANLASSLAKKKQAKGTSIMPPPAHGVKIITNYNKMKQYGHMQGNSVLPGYHPKRNETLNVSFKINE